MNEAELRAHLAERHGAMTGSAEGLAEMHAKLHEWAADDKPIAGHVHTESGKMLTDADFEALADEAEKGYDISKLRPRGRADETRLRAVMKIVDELRAADPTMEMPQAWAEAQQRWRAQALHHTPLQPREAPDGST